MAGEEQYINPIIQAMANLQRSFQERQELGLKTQQVQNEQQARQAALKIEQQRADQAEKQIENEHEFHSTSLEQSHAVNQAQMELMKMSAIKQIRDSVMSGMAPESLVNSGSAPQGGQSNTPGIVGGIPQTPDTRAISLPGLGLNIPLNQIPTQEQLIKGESARVGAEETAKLQAKQPFDFAMSELNYGHEKALADAHADLTERMKDKELDWDKVKTNLDLGSRYQIAKMSEANQYAMSHERTQAEYGVSPQQMQAGLTGLASGELPVNMTNPVDRNMATTFIASGGKVVPKEDTAAMRHLGMMSDVYKKMEAVESQLPDEQKLGINSAVMNAATMKQLNKLPIPTDVQESLNELGAQVQTIVRNTQQTTGSRFNPTEMNNMQNLVTGIKTKQQMQRAEQSIQNTIGGVNRTLQTGMPNWQQNINYSRNGVTPLWIQEQQQLDQQNPKGNAAQGLKPDIDKSIKLGKAVWSDPNAPGQ